MKKVKIVLFLLSGNLVMVFVFFYSMSFSSFTFPDLKEFLWTSQISRKANIELLLVYYLSILPLTVAVMLRYWTVIYLYSFYYLLNWVLFYYDEHYLAQTKNSSDLGLLLLIIFLDIVVAPCLLIGAFLYDKQKHKKHASSFHSSNS